MLIGSGLPDEHMPRPGISTAGRKPMNQGAINPEPHEELAVFLGDWHAEATSYGGDEWPTAPSTP